MSSDKDRLILLDACAVINFYATGHMPQIVANMEERVGIAAVVERESLYIRSRSASNTSEPELIDLSEMIDTGLIEVLEAEHDELNTFIDFAFDLDDGEAMTLALAVHRDGIVVTDDRKAIRVAPDSLDIRPTLEPIKIWLDSASMIQASQRNVLIAIQERASYMPGKSHQLREWWDQILGQG